ncbi:amidase [Rhabdobacter roseus]|uniref:Amidase n=1 Tax=Rhabdobacter roseus TaxID=1655419 RepID=A0A840TGB2_9BACT|nr:amidase [Rhabdobacter roseus]MBB5281985.1 amidase [Rhabdobacter roseus]
MKVEEYLRYDAVGLADLVRRGEVTPHELLENALVLAEKINPRLNAIVQPHYEEGRKMVEALPAEAPLRGVPFLVKDLSIEWAGTPMRSGSKGYLKYISSQDGNYVKRCKKAGLVLFGKTNTPELGLTPFTEPTLFGPARNPWNPDHSAGGSSGGSAAAVAAGIVPAATASDGGGSIRIPASCCGLFGLKPSRGRISLAPLTGESWAGAVAEGTVTRSVRDSAALLDVLNGYEPGDPYQIQVPERPYAEEVLREVGKLRIGFSAQHPYPGLSLDAECVAAVYKAARLLESLGHEVVEVPLPYSADVFKEAFLPMIVGETAAALRIMGDWLARPVKADDVEPNTWLLAQMGEVFTAADYAYALGKWNQLARGMAHFHQQYDVFLTPTLSRPPIRIGALQNSTQENVALRVLQTTGGYRFLKGSSVVDQLVEKTFGYIPYTPIANMTGQPSMSVPLHWTESGLPVGMMFTGRMGEEGLLFRLAGQLERAEPWMDRRPPLL